MVSSFVRQYILLFARENQKIPTSLLDFPIIPHDNERASFSRHVPPLGGRRAAHLTGEFGNERWPTEDSHSLLAALLFLAVRSRLRLD